MEPIPDDIRWGHVHPAEGTNSSGLTYREKRHTHTLVPMDSLESPIRNCGRTVEFLEGTKVNTQSEVLLETFEAPCHPLKSQKDKKFWFLSFFSTLPKTPPSNAFSCHYHTITYCLLLLFCQISTFDFTLLNRTLWGEVIRGIMLLFPNRRHGLYAVL